MATKTAAAEFLLESLTAPESKDGTFDPTKLSSLIFGYGILAQMHATEGDDPVHRGAATAYNKVVADLKLVTSL